MPKASHAAAIARIMSLVLGVRVSPEDSVSMAAEPAWDSMRHIELIMTLEQQLGISFDPEDIPKLTSQRAIADKVAELHAG